MRVAMTTEVAAIYGTHHYTTGLGARASVFFCPGIFAEIRVMHHRFQEAHTGHQMRRVSSGANLVCRMLRHCREVTDIGRRRPLLLRFIMLSHSSHHFGFSTSRWDFLRFNTVFCQYFSLIKAEAKNGVTKAALWGSSLILSVTT